MALLQTLHLQNLLVEPVTHFELHFHVINVLQLRESSLQMECSARSMRFTVFSLKSHFP
jgi:hypothetical protein